MKKVLRSLGVLLFIFISITGTVIAAEPISIIVDSKNIELSTPARVENGTTLVPLRDIFEAFGVTPVWNKNTQIITAEKDGVKIWLQSNNKKAKVGNKEVILNVPGKSYNGNTLVPLRFISEAFGINPQWNKSTNTIIINQNIVSCH